MTDWRVLQDEVATIVPDLEPVDAVFCDPPYGLGDPLAGEDLAEVLDAWVSGARADTGSGGGFMGREWDSSVIDPPDWEAILDVAKPGACMASFGGTRTFDLQSVAQRLAGWEMRDEVLALAWCYGSGFPKSHDISKAIDKQKEVDREVIGEKRVSRDWSRDGKTGDMAISRESVEETTVNITAPATDEAETWDGYGTALAPAHEPIGLWRKPTGKTYAETALEEGCGALNIDGCRVETAKGETVITSPRRPQNEDGRTIGGNWSGDVDESERSGRWPANLALCHHPACGDECVSQCHIKRLDAQSGYSKSRGETTRGAGGQHQTFGEYDSQGRVPCPQDEGGASRFFPRFRYQAKAARSEREAGLFGEGRQNQHETVKPIELCEWIARLLLPPPREEGEPPRRLLVPFSGSGSEMIGAILAGWDEVIGIEMSDEYCDLARRRLEWWSEHGHDAIDAHKAEGERREYEEETGQSSIFDLDGREG